MRNISKFSHFQEKKFYTNLCVFVSFFLVLSGRVYPRLLLTVVVSPEMPGAENVLFYRQYLLLAEGRGGVLFLAFQVDSLCFLCLRDASCSTRVKTPAAEGSSIICVIWM